RDPRENPMLFPLRFLQRPLSRMPGRRHLGTSSGVVEDPARIAHALVEPEPEELVRDVVRNRDVGLRRSHSYPPRALQEDPRTTNQRQRQMLGHRQARVAGATLFTKSSAQ